MPLRSATVAATFFCCALWAQAQGPVIIFRANSYLQSIAVEIVDKQGDGVGGLTAADVTLLEDGHPPEDRVLRRARSAHQFDDSPGLQWKHEIQPEIDAFAGIAAAIDSVATFARMGFR
jgi:hypothetical protein